MLSRTHSSLHIRDFTLINPNAFDSEKKNSSIAEQLRRATKRGMANDTLMCAPDELRCENELENCFIYVISSMCSRSSAEISLSGVVKTAEHGSLLPLQLSRSARLSWNSRFVLICHREKLCAIISPFDGDHHRARKIPSPFSKAGLWSTTQRRNPEKSPKREEMLSQFVVIKSYLDERSRRWPYVRRSGHMCEGGKKKRTNPGEEKREEWRKPRLPIFDITSHSREVVFSARCAFLMHMVHHIIISASSSPLLRRPLPRP